jgi:formylglycine-generating enzyme required for sulfatase activity
MALILAGPFEMGAEAGAPDERPVHTVLLDEFYIDVYEVTNASFADFLTSQGNQTEGGAFWLDIEESHIFENEIRFTPEPGFEDHPVVEVTWHGAAAFCEWRGARLPTEAEWEKAARGGLEGAAYPWGDGKPGCETGSESGAQSRNCDGQTVPVGRFGANGYGLYDMAGNVFEWVLDWYDENYYAISPLENPTGPETSGSFGNKLMRGGAWRYDPTFLRLDIRLAAPTDLWFDDVGFRCARSP